jgi:hypothetical protein
MVGAAAEGVIIDAGDDACRLGGPQAPTDP